MRKMKMKTLALLHSIKLRSGLIGLMMFSVILASVLSTHNVTYAAKPPTKTPNLTTPSPTPVATNTPSGGCGTTNVALNKPVTASSIEDAPRAAANAVDGNTTTRWGSQFSDPQWIYVDLGSTQSICRVELKQNFS